MTATYESFYGLMERPFSLTPDPKYFFKSRSHGRAIDSLIFGLRRRDPVLLLTGDSGLGKTTACRTLVEQLRRRVPVAYAANPFLSAADLLRLLLHDFRAAASDNASAVQRDRLAHDLYDGVIDFIRGLGDTKESAVLIVDEAHDAPPLVVDELARLSAVSLFGRNAIQIVLAAEPPEGDAGAPGFHRIERQIATRVRLLPFGREECAAYVTHRLKSAGTSGVQFTTRAMDTLFAMSGGVPRLVNLLCERALQESAARHSRTIEPSSIQAAAAALDLLRARPKRFRWFQKRVS